MKRLSFLALGIISLILSAIGAGGVIFVERSMEVTCATVTAALSGLLCGPDQPLVAALWVFPGIALLAAALFILVHFLTKESMGYGEDDHF
ncbi:hypothetical protein LCGC14_0045440 [marine sediment metagenome]|uniref:Uncharacterized protein n=2 Tax=root TaxID=1 RepID=A0A7V1BI92_9RHOB|nr:hypothetical protein [Sulfitobacter litoralis]